MRSPANALIGSAARADGAVRAFVLAGDMRLTALPGGLLGGSGDANGGQASTSGRVFEFVLAADSLLVQAKSRRPPCARANSSRHYPLHPRILCVWNPRPSERQVHQGAATSLLIYSLTHLLTDSLTHLPTY